ncbi:dodecin family protein [Robertkochia flava]|uniref:dodecin family protein n=1 Tax=Robertkochia flava TaxID=3447986 RepID=UPI001CCFA77C|nr:dodecin family protein [Robertkochia marina]
MSVLKVIEVLADSDKSWEDAAHQAVEKASATVQNIKSVYIAEHSATIKDGKISSYRVNAKITFGLK